MPDKSYQSKSLHCITMLKPQKNNLITGFFGVYISWIIRRHFYQIKFTTPQFDVSKSALLVANHFSWWDGFLLYHVNKLAFKKRFHIMVLEESMQKLGFLKYLGSFSVAKNSRQVLESLNYAAELLAHPDNMVVIFPQGKLYSNFVDDVYIQKGISHIAGRAKSGFQYIFAATFVEGFQHKKPTAHIYLNTLSVDDVAPAQIPARYNQFYKSAKQQQTNITV
jgi:1-acyl-sn-glycerol-3-phosphate acyltransferase